ncbi:MAG: hypothetical protein V1724_05245 [Chloroflexota bacterium]
MEKYLKLKNAHEARLDNIIDMGLDFSAMIRLFERGSKRRLQARILDDLPKVFEAKSEKQFVDFHASFCNWGRETVMLAEKTKNGQITKKSGPASYGQIAKTLDVVLKVAVYYCHLPNCEKYQSISGWLNAAVDTKMMALLSKYYPEAIRPWPATIEKVDDYAYAVIQDTVRKFIKEKHSGSITPVQFDDIYFKALKERGR